MTIELSGDNRPNFKTKFDKYTQTEKPVVLPRVLLKTDIAVKN